MHLLRHWQRMKPPKHKQFVESNEVNVKIANPQVHCNFVNLCSSGNFTNLAWIHSQLFALYRITPVLTCRIWECHQVDRTSTKYLLSIVTQSAQDKVIWMKKLPLLCNHPGMQIRWIWTLYKLSMCKLNFETVIVIHKEVWTNPCTYYVLHLSLDVFYLVVVHVDKWTYVICQWTFTTHQWIYMSNT